MATAYTSLLGLALPVTGELQGTWGTTVNDSITSLLDTAVAGTTTLSTDGDVTLTTTTGASNQARQAILLCSGARTALRTITAPAQSKIYTVINATTGGFSVKVVGVGPTTGVTIVAGESALIAWNGSDFIKISNTGGSASFTNVTVSGTTTLSGLTASTALALNASKEVVSVTNTGTGNNVLSASPTLTGTIGGASMTLSSLTSGRVTYAGASGLLQDSANFTFNGTDLTVSGAVNAGSVNATTLDLTNLEVTNIKAKDGTASMTLADVTGVASFSANPVFSGGTANGVLYLDGSKVATSGSALTFDGTNLSLATGKVTTSTAGTGAGFQWGGTTTTSRLYDDGVGSVYLDVGAGASNTDVPLFIRTKGSGGIIYLQPAGTSGYTLSTTGQAWSISGTEQMRLTSTGLGIGTSSPGQKLTVQGGVNVTSSATLPAAQGSMLFSYESAVNRCYMGDGTGYSFAFSKRSASTTTDLMTLTDTGNLGIGTSSPSQKFTVAVADAVQAVNLQGATGRVRFRPYVDATNGAIIDAVNAAESAYGVMTLQASTLRLFGNNGIGATIDSSGNLGIGTSSPSARLHAAAASPTRGIVNITSATGSTGAQLQVTQSGIEDWALGQPAGVNAFAFWSGRNTGNDGVERMRLDSSGNLGLGVTPSAWGSNRIAVQVVGASLAGVVGSNALAEVSANRFINSSGQDIYVSSNAASVYQQATGAHFWYTAPSGTAGNAISFTQAMTLDASGDLLVGTTTASGGRATISAVANYGDLATGYSLVLANSIGTGTSSNPQNIGVIQFGNPTLTNNDEGRISVVQESPSASTASSMRFFTNGGGGNATTLERARITSGGDLLVGTTSGTVTVNGLKFFSDGSFYSVQNSGVTSSIYNKSNYTSGTDFFADFRLANTTVGSISANGSTTSYSTSSDRRLKENIAPAADAGLVIDAIEVVQHDWKVGGHTRFGVIAQDLNAVAPEAVTAGDDGDEIERTWGVDYSKLVPMLIKEIQSLRARVAALEAK